MNNTPKHCFETFDDIISYMESFTNLEKQTDHYTTRVYRLDRMRALLDHFAHPEKDFQAIHVAGSKGKGSTAMFLASAIQAQGFKTGLYASPHLIDYRERFSLCGTFFPDQFLVKVGNRLREGLEGFCFSDEWGETSVTTFELYTLYAFMLFSAWGCKYAVIETGLGGRLDATNTITPIASVLCPIELEHTQILGKTIHAIATEKSKIIKEGIPSFVAALLPEARNVMASQAKDVHSPQWLLSDLLLDMESKTTTDGEIATYRWKITEDTAKWHLKETTWHDRPVFEEHFTLAMKGRVMAANCALALLCLRILKLYAPASKVAMESCTLPGRFEKISDDPPIYIDGAHTDHSLKALIDSMEQLYAPEKTIVIFGAIQGKDHLHMAHLLLHSYKTIILCRPGTYKKSDMQSLYELFMQQDTDNTHDILLEIGADAALKEARQRCPAEGAILVCGSFYLAGEIAEEWKREASCL